MSGGAGGGTAVDPCEVDVTVNSAKSIQDLAGVSCARTMYVMNSTLTTLEGLEHFTKLTSLIVGYTPQLSFDVVGNPVLQSLKGLEGLSQVEFIHIEGDPKLTDLSGLSGLTKNMGKLEIVDNDSLASLEGLNNLSEAGDVAITGNKLLTDLKGLRGLTHLNSLVLENEPLIKNFVGLDNVTYFGSWSSDIIGNDALEDFTGLAKVASIGNEFTVANNKSLKSFNGFQSLKLLAWTFTVSGNPELSSISALSTVNEIRSDVAIKDNPKLPSCQIQAMLAGAGKTCTCSGNDDAASCQ